MIKRITALLCAFVMLAGMLAGCGGKEETPTIKTPEISSIGSGISGNIPSVTPAQPADSNSYTVSVKAPTSWGTVRLWAWSESVGDLYNAWPGETMNFGSDGWYTLTIPKAYDYVIVNGLDGNVQTQDEWTGGENIWFVIEENGQYEITFEAPSASAGGSAPASSSTAAAYDELLRTYGVTDVTVVSSNLDIIAGVVKMDETTIQKQEYGIEGNTVKELGMAFYFSLDGMSVQDKADFDKKTREVYDALFGGLEFAKLNYKLTSEVYTMTICFKGMDNAANVSALADFMGITASDLKPDGTFPVPTVSELESQGLYVKVM